LITTRCGIQGPFEKSVTDELLAPYPSCSQEEKPVPVDLSKREDVYPEKETFNITYAYLPQFSHRVSFARHNPLVEYLKKETGLPHQTGFSRTPLTST
jgi:hypothetical protein